MTETSLDRAYAAFASGGEAEALRFYQLLADTPLSLLLAHEADGDEIAPQVFDLSEGPVVLAFDSEERLAGFQSGPVPYATLPGRVVAQGLVGQGVSLGVNLGTGAASETLLPPEALAHLLSLLDVTPEQTAALPRRFSPPVVPQALEAALHMALGAATGLAAGAVLAAVTYDTGAKGHILALVGAEPAAEPALARAVAEALAFAGLEAAVLDVTFLSPEDAALRAMAAVGQSYAIKAPPAPDASQTAAQMPAAPGTDPSRPPRLR